MANRVTLRRLREPASPPVRLRPPALRQVFRQLRAIEIRTDYYLAATVTAQPRPPARLPKVAFQPRLSQSRNPRGRLGSVPRRDMRGLSVLYDSFSLQHCP